MMHANSPRPGERPDGHAFSPTRADLLAMLLIVALALGLRLYRLGAQSLWNDEGTSVALAQRSLPTIVQHAAHDIHPPLYYLLLHGWIALFGPSEFAVRSLSALAGALVVALTFVLALRCCEERARPCVLAWLAALFVALSPFHVYYAQEARMYMLVTLFGALSMLAFDGLMRSLAMAGSERTEMGDGRPRSGRWRSVGYLLATICAVYSHYYAFALLLAQNLAWSWWFLRQAQGRRWPILLRWVGLQLLIVLAYVPWLIVSWGSLTRWPAVSAPLSLGDLVTSVARVFALGVTVSGGPRTTWLGIGLSALTLSSLGWLWRDRGRSRRISLMLYGLVPVALMYLLSLSRPMYKAKFLLLATPAYHLLQAAGILALAALLGRLFRRRWPGLVLGVALAGGVCAASGYSLAHLYWDPAYARDDYRAIVSYFSATARPGDALLINAPSQIETVDYYYRGPWPQYPLPRQRPLEEEQTRAELERIVARHDRLYAIFWATDESDPTSLIERWLDGHCFKAMDSWFGNIRLVVYSVPRAAAPEIEHTVKASLGDRVELRGYTLLTPQPQAGDIVQLTLFWEALAPIERRYKVFAHLLDGQGQIVAQRDSEPVGGGRPTTSWSVGELVRDNYGLALPPGTPPGAYLLRIGMYGLEDGQRLAIESPDGVVSAGTALDLAQVRVGRPDAQPPLAALDLQASHQMSWGGPRLVGHSLYRLGYEHEPRLSLRPGDVAKLILFWRAETKDEGAGPGDDLLTLELIDSKQALVWQQDLQITGGAYPYALWQAGEVVRDIHTLYLPGHLAPATYALVLRPSHLSKGYLLTRLKLE